MGRVALWIASFSLAWAALPAAAQSYRCVSPTGSIYQSAAPCTVSHETRNAVAAARAAAASAAQADRAAAVRQQQCGESRRILVSRRARSAPSEGEKVELQRLEENFRSRCS